MLSGEGSDRNDRNIDHVISCNRREPYDDPKAPKSILTRYGEGYRWLGEAATDDVPAADILVGPLRGLATIGAHARTAGRFAEVFLDAVSDDLPDGRRADFAPTPVGPHAQSVELTLFVGAVALECVMTARQAPSGAVLAVARRRLDSPRPDLSGIARDATKLRLSRTWRSLVTVGVETPIPIAMHDAASLPVGKNASWARNDQHLKCLLEDDPEHPVLRLFFATHLHPKYILRGAQTASRSLSSPPCPASGTRPIASWRASFRISSTGAMTCPP